jgi:hypothetical protein
MSIPVNSVSQYFSLPRSERTVVGIYKLPESLPAEFEEGEEGWSVFSKKIKREYPIQWFFREWIFSHSNPVYHFLKKMQWKVFGYNKI